jgi:hypothetical protein
MNFTIHLDFNPHNANHRRVAAWLASQPDPAETVVRLLRAAIEGERRMRQWEEMASLLADDLRQVRTQMSLHPTATRPEAKPAPPEDPESARRLDSLFD